MSNATKPVAVGKEGSEDFEPIFELGGPADRLMQRVGIIKGNGPSIGRRSAAFIATTWLPLLVFASLSTHGGCADRLPLLLLSTSACGNREAFWLASSETDRRRRTGCGPSARRELP